MIARRSIIDTAQLAFMGATVVELAKVVDAIDRYLVRTSDEISFRDLVRAWPSIAASYPNARCRSILLRTRPVRMTQSTITLDRHLCHQCAPVLAAVVREHTGRGFGFDLRDWSNFG